MLSVFGDDPPSMLGIADGAHLHTTLYSGITTSLPSILSRCEFLLAVPSRMSSASARFWAAHSGATHVCDRPTACYL